MSLSKVMVSMDKLKVPCGVSTTSSAVEQCSFMGGSSE